jgi:5-methylcytosine-specific restriction protein A
MIMPTTHTRNPPWSRDELILALDLYIRFKGNPPSKADHSVVDLSDTLNQLATQIANRTSKFRNPNGVYMKVMNFRRFDPIYIEQGKRGLQRGGKLEEEVWNNFASDPSKLAKVANAIRAALTSEQIPEAAPDDDNEVAEAEEGKVLTRVHRSRERSRKLVEQKKQSVLKHVGVLKCEACGFDFEVAYGERGKGFIEVHHVKPVHSLKPGEKTRLEDLALICSNCHRIVHLRRPWLTIGELKALTHH